MSRIFRRSQDTPQSAAGVIPLLPSPVNNQVYVRVSPLDGGQYTEPADAFVSPPDRTDPYAVVTVPSLPFLIQHPGTTRFNRHGSYVKPCNILFDRGIRSDPLEYSRSIQQEIEHRKPVRLPDPISKQLSRGGLTMQDIDLIALSHSHWSHTGDAIDFAPQDVSYLVGPSAAAALEELTRTQPHRVDSNTFLPRHRTIQLPIPGAKGAYHSDATKDGTIKMEWQPLGPFPAVVDLFEDGSVYAVDLPGHAQGHIGLLCRCAPHKWALLAGDVAHDIRILHGERSIATWRDQSGRDECVHNDRRLTEETLSRIRMLVEGQRMGGYQLDVILAHDMDWILKNLESFWPNSLFRGAHHVGPIGGTGGGSFSSRTSGANGGGGNRY